MSRKRIKSEKILEIIANKIRQEYPSQLFLCSKPVMAIMDGHYHLAVFICFMVKKEYTDKIIKKPYMWVCYDIIENKIVFWNKKHQNGFCRNINEELIDISNDGCQTPNANYNEACHNMFDTVINQILSDDLLDMELYCRYFKYMVSVVPNQLAKVYYQLSIPIKDTEFNKINTKIMLPYAVLSNLKKRNGKNLIRFYSQESLYTVLSPDTVREYNGEIEAEPYIIENNKQKYALITNVLNHALNFAKQYHLMYGDNFLVAELNNTDTYNSFVQFLKYVSSSYAENINFGLYNNNGIFSNVFTCQAGHALQVLGEKPDDMSLISIECTTKKTLINGNYRKWYKVMASGEIQRYESIQLIDTNKNKIKYDKNMSEEDIINKLLQEKFLYVISNKNTKLPYMNKDGLIYVYIEKQDAEVEADKQDRDEYILDIACLRNADIIPTMDFLISKGIDGILLNNQFEIKKENLPCYKPDYGNKNMQLKKLMVLFRQEDKSKKIEEDLMFTLSQSKLFIPTIIKDGVEKPMLLAIRKNNRDLKILHAYTDIEELKNAGSIKYSGIKEVYGNKMEYHADSIRINLADYNFFDISMKRYMQIMMIYNLLDTDDQKHIMEKAYAVANFPELADECIYVLQNRKFKKVHCIKINETTVEQLCRLENMPAIDAYYQFALMLDGGICYRH